MGLLPATAGHTRRDARHRDRGRGGRRRRDRPVRVRAVLHERVDHVLQRRHVPGSVLHARRLPHRSAHPGVARRARDPARRQTRPRRRVRRPRWPRLRDRVGDHLGADRGRVVRRRHGVGDRLRGRRVPEGWIGPVDRRPPAGAPLGPDRQDRQLLRRLCPAADGIPEDHRALPAGRTGGRAGGRIASDAARAVRAEGLEPADVARIGRLVPPTPTAYHRLNPLTKAIVATVGSIGAFLLGGYPGPLLISVVMLALATSARVTAQLLRASLLLPLPIAISVVLVSVFTRAGSTVLFTLGPFDATAEGVDFAGQTLVRLLAISLSIGLFVATTAPRAFVIDLERRGVPPRLAFVASATIEAA